MLVSEGTLCGPLEGNTIGMWDVSVCEREKEMDKIWFVVFVSNSRERGVKE